MHAVLSEIMTTWGLYTAGRVSVLGPNSFNVAKAHIPLSYFTDETVFNMHYVQFSWRVRHFAGLHWSVRISKHSFSPTVVLRYGSVS